jgi:hypothetical protein
MWFSTAQRQLDMAGLTMGAQAATTAAEALGKIDRHEDDCRKYREAMQRALETHRIEVSQRLDKQDAASDAKHAENLQKFDRLFRAVYIAAGVLLAASALLSHGEVADLIKTLVK